MLPSVRKSAKNAQDNADDGGHIWQHIYVPGCKPEKADSKDTQKKKVMFKDQSDFEQAWGMLIEGHGTNIQCQKGSKNPEDCVKANTVGITSALKCKSVDNEKMCTEVEEITPNSFRFKYIKLGKNWILQSAYPSVAHCKI